MFEGTDLNVAYGLSDDSMGGFDNAPPKPIVQQKPTPSAMSFGAQPPATPQTQVFNTATTHAVDIP